MDDFGYYDFGDLIDMQGGFDDYAAPFVDSAATSGGLYPMPPLDESPYYREMTTGDFARMDRAGGESLPPSGEDFPSTGDFARMDRMPQPADTLPARVETLPDGSFVLRPRNAPGTGPVQSPTDDAFTRTLDRAVEVGIAALRLNQAYRQAGSPAPRVSGSLGSVATVAGRDGWLVTTTTAGTTRRMPTKGQPYLTPDGATILNNGDGTYDLIEPSGARQVLRYAGGATSSGGALASLSSIPPALLIGGALALLALARR